MKDTLTTMSLLSFMFHAIINNSESCTGILGQLVAKKG
jgi:hypothetical protein